MNKEIERKFLVNIELFLEEVSKNKENIINREEIKQGYIENIDIIFEKNRLFILKDDQKCFININETNIENLLYEFFEKTNDLEKYKFNAKNNNVFRIRTVNSKNDKIAFLTLKGKNSGISRTELEYVIDYNESIEILKKFCDKIIEKTRYEYLFDNKLWEIDVFQEQNEGLIVAELELSNENETFNKPNFILEDVSLDYKYYNNNLLNNPFINWKANI